MAYAFVPLYFFFFFPRKTKPTGKGHESEMDGVILLEYTDVIFWLFVIDAQETK